MLSISDSLLLTYLRPQPLKEATLKLWGTYVRGINGNYISSPQSALVLILQPVMSSAGPECGTLELHAVGWHTLVYE